MKRKRGVCYYSKDEENPKKRMKFEEDIQKIPFLKENKLDDSTELDVYDEENDEFETVKIKYLKKEKHIILPKKFPINEESEVVRSIHQSKKEMSQKKTLVGFSSINSDKDVKRVFGKRTEFLPKWKYIFPEKFSDKVTKRGESLMKEYNLLDGYVVGKSEDDEKEYISTVIKEAIRIVKSEKKILQLGMYKERRHTGNDAFGPLDYEICDGNEENVLIIIEAKGDDEYKKKGVPQLLMQLKAIQEEEGMKDKWYYGFAATRDQWTPCRVNMKKKEVQIGKKLKLGIFDVNDFNRILYLMKGMILKEFDNI